MTRALLVVLLLAGAAYAEPARKLEDYVTEATGFPAMVKLRTLEGTWVGRVTESPVPVDVTINATLTYEAVSGGQAVLERLQMGDKKSEEMVSMYHQAGDQMMMTHYCSSNTHPRMRTKFIPRDLRRFKFEFVDSTNIMLANWMNIESCELEFVGPDKLIQRWKTRTPGEKACVVEVRRVK